MRGELGPTSSTLPWAFPGARIPFCFFRHHYRGPGAQLDGKGKGCVATPALSASLAPLPHPPNAALPGAPLWVLLHAFLLTPRGLGEAHSTPA